MIKVDKNDPCPCGSGRKLEQCCLKFLEETFSGGGLLERIDVEKKERLIITDQILENQIHRDNHKITDSFDKYYKNDIQEISVEIAKIFIPFFINEKYTLDDPIRFKSWTILLNAVNTIFSAVTILRCGYKLQPGILISRF